MISQFKEAAETIGAWYTQFWRVTKYILFWRFLVLSHIILVGTENWIVL